MLGSEAWLSESRGLPGDVTQGATRGRKGSDSANTSQRLGISESATRHIRVSATEHIRVESPEGAAGRRVHGVGGAAAEGGGEGRQLRQRAGDADGVGGVGVL